MTGASIPLAPIPAPCAPGALLARRRPNREPTTRAPARVRTGHERRSAGQQGPYSAAGRLHGGYQLFAALAVPFPTARTGPQAHAENRAATMAAHHCHGKCWPICPRAVPLGWLSRDKQSTGTACGGDHWYEYPRYLFANESGDILRLCGEALDQLGVAWRYSRRNSISVARRGAVARLDEFVGPKY